MAAKVFTVDEANRMLPLVERIVRDIVAAHGVLQERAGEYSTLDSEAPGTDERRRELRREIDSLTEQVNGYITELHRLGCLFKGFDEGLVDFYTLHGDQPVFLCWKLGEASIEWWHEIDAGYAGRQPLAALLD
jgi:hypothetical protein